MVVRREVAHTGALLDDRAAVGEPDPKQLHTAARGGAATAAAAAAAASGGAGPGVVAVVAAMGAPPSHGGLS